MSYEQCLHYIDGRPYDYAYESDKRLRPLMRVNDMDRALVTVSDKSIYYLILPVGGSVKVVANLLEAVRFTKPEDAGEFAAEFIKLHRTAHGKTKLLPYPYTGTAINQSLNYLVDLKKDSVHVTQSNRACHTTTTLYNGPISSFVKWASASKDLRDAIDKVVKFVYKGGSGTHERLIKLTGIEGTGQGTILRGWDIKQSTADKPAYRTYRIGNVVGNVEVVG